MRTPWIVLSLLLCGGLLALGCPTVDDDDAADDDDATGDDDDDVTPGTAMVSGVVDREINTCPPVNGGSGTLCMFLLSDCSDLGTAVAAGTVANADMGLPNYVVYWEVGEVPDGTWQLYGFLDDDDSGCEGDITAGDFYLASGCLEVTVAGQEDVEDVHVTFDGKCS